VGPLFLNKINGYGAPVSGKVVQKDTWNPEGDFSAIAQATIFLKVSMEDQSQNSFVSVWLA
jgi:hypothetical protein